MSDNGVPTQTITLPDAQYPMVTRMISNALFPENGKEDPVTWTVSHEHPLVPDMKVVRMFATRDRVEVYSVSSNGRAGMRNIIPMSWVRLVEEAMPLDVFVDELSDAESGDDDDDDEPDPDIGEPEAVAPQPDGIVS